ncbi:unnamed protein product, partial [Iphiclides podalirius]
MQNMTFAVSTMSRLAATLAAVQELVKTPGRVLDEMLAGRRVLTDHERLRSNRHEERPAVGAFRGHVGCSSYNLAKDRGAQFLGFCAVCLSVGALIPGSAKLGQGKRRYAFCGGEMARRFNADPQRYINEALEYARSNPHMIYLLGISEDVESVKEVDELVTKHLPRTKVCNKDIQTDTHPLESYIEKNYSSDLWEWKRRACQWASIVNCRTHSTQTEHSHMRSEVQCQTVHHRDKGLQTNKECGVNTIPRNTYLWALRGQLGDGQHVVSLDEAPHSELRKAVPLIACTKHCCKNIEAIREKIRELEE